MDTNRNAVWTGVARLLPVFVAPALRIASTALPFRREAIVSSAYGFGAGPSLFFPLFLVGAGGAVTSVPWAARRVKTEYATVVRVKHHPRITTIRTLATLGEKERFDLGT